MLIHNQHTAPLTNIRGAIDFTIDTESTAFIIQMLSSKMYEDPVMAVVRETVTNAIDANNEADCATVPIDLTAVSTGDGYLLIVGDCGLGISPECIETTLTKLGKSSKSGSNNSHGGYGLGILSVFAVASQASLQTNYNGEHYSYLMFINEQGIPALTLLGRRASKPLELGSKIQVPISEDLKEELYQAIGWFSSTIQPKPKASFVNHSKEFLDQPAPLIYRGEGWRLSQPKALDVLEWDVCVENLKLVLEIGQITYNPSYELLKSIYEKAGHVLQTTPILPILKTAIRYQSSNNLQEREALIITLPIGQLDLTGSRESILNTQNNCNLIWEALQQAVIKIQETYTALITQNALAFKQKLIIAYEWQLSNFNHDEIVYNVEQTIKASADITRIETKGNSVKEEINCAQMRYDRIYNRNANNRNLPVAVLISTKGDLRACKKLLKQHLQANPKFSNRSPDDLPYLGLPFILVNSKQKLAELQTSDVFKQLTKDLPVLIQELPKNQTTPEESSARYYKGVVNSFAKSHATNVISDIGEPILYVASLKDLYHQFLELKKLDLNLNLPLCKEVHLMTNLESVVYLINKGDGDWKVQLNMFSVIAQKLNLDISVYILPNKIANALQYLSSTNLITVSSMLDPLLHHWTATNWREIEVIGFAPGLRSCRSGISLPISCESYQERLTNRISIIRHLLSLDSIVRIATSSQLELLTQYVNNFELWSAVLEYCDGLNLVITSKNVKNFKLRDIQVQDLNDYNFNLTLNWLLQDLLELVPILDDYKLRLPTLKEPVLFKALDNLSKLMPAVPS